MKKFLSCLYMLFMGVSCTKGGNVRNVTPKEAFGLLKNDLAVLVDVREEGELRETGFAEKAKWFPMSKIKNNDPEWKSFVSSLSKDKEVIFYCAVGGRAGVVAHQVAAEGFRTGNMGGFSDWKGEGLPVSELK